MMSRAVAITFSTVMGLGLVAVTVSAIIAGAWSWWMVPMLVLSGLFLFVFFAYAVLGFTLDRNGQPVTARDADLYARWRAAKCTHQREAWDGFVRENARPRSAEGQA